MAVTLSPHRHLRSLSEPSLAAVAVPVPHPLTELFGVRPMRAAIGLGLALIAVIALSLAVGHGAFAALAPAPPAAGASAVGSVAHTVVVQPGDTLWSIARRVQPDGDVRPLVDRLTATYGTVALQPGARLSVRT